MNMNFDTIRNGIAMPNIFAQLPKIPVASAVSGLIVAALILMTPNPWFEAFIIETGLPNLLTPAEPPLGARARIVFALIAALIVTIGAWGVLTAILGRKSRTSSEEHYGYAEADEAHESPRIRRRADSHPDAPYRRPIMAGDEMGVPLDLVTVAPEEDDGGEDAFDTLDLGEVAEIVDMEPAFLESAESGAEPIAEEVPLTHADLSEADMEPESEQVKPVFAISLPRRDGVTEDATDSVIEADEPDEAIAAPTVSAEPSDGIAELADLVARLEAGLERKQAREQSAQKSFADSGHENVTAHPQAEPKANPADNHDARLREALNALQKVSGQAS